MLNPRLSNAAANLAADAVLARLDGGYLRLYTGEQPTGPDVPVGSEVRLAELRFGTPAFHPASDGFAAAFPIDSDPAAAGTGQAAWFRTFEANGTTAVWDGSVGLIDADMTLNTLTIADGAVVSVTGLSYTQAKAKP